MPIFGLVHQYMHVAGKSQFFSGVMNGFAINLAKPRGHLCRPTFINPQDCYLEHSIPLRI